MYWMATTLVNYLKLFFLLLYNLQNSIIELHAYLIALALLREFRLFFVFRFFKYCFDKSFNDTFYYERNNNLSFWSSS